MALNRIEGVRGGDGVLRFVVRGGDGMLRFVVKYLAIFYALIIYCRGNSDSSYVRI